MLTSSCKKKSDESPVPGPVPVLTTLTYSNVLLSTAKLSGNITSDGGTFVTKRGFCWSRTNQNPTVQDDTLVTGNGAGFFSDTISGLIGQTTFYVRAFATNNNGTGYGSILSMKTIDSTITDIDNNHYHIIQIGNQVWMGENLKTTKYSNGDAVNHPLTPAAWNQAKTGGYCDYDNNPANSVVYGRLYNYYAVADSRNIAPAGWHVPDYNEWTRMINYIGGGNTAGGKLKETGTSHWDSPNAGATNEFGFTALPGGIRDDQGVYSGIKSGGAFWIATTSGTDLAWFFSVNNTDQNVFSFTWFKNYGFSLHCVRD